MTAAILRRAALIFLPLVLVAACIIYLLYLGQSAAIRAEAIAGERRVAVAAEQRVTQTLMMILADALYLATQGALEAGLRTGEPSALQHLQREHLVFARSRAIYNQIRLVDLGGREITRVDWNRGAPTIVPTDRLRDLADAQIFRDTMKLEQGRLSVTQLTLVDDPLAPGGPKIPVISVAAPIFDAAGRRSGAVILDYLGQLLINRIISLSGGASMVWLTDDRGTWLIGPADEGGVTLRLSAGGDNQENFKTAFANAWRAIKEDTTPGIAETEAGRFNYAKINPDKYRPIALQSENRQVVMGPSWIAIVHTSRDAIWAHGAELRRHIAAAAAVLLLLLAGLAIGLARHQVQRHESETRLRENETRMRDLLESAPDGVIIVDADGTIQLVNAQVERLFGYPRHELIGRCIDLLVPLGLCNAPQQQRAGYLGAAQTRPTGPGLDLRGVRRDGSEFPISVSLSPTATGRETTIFCDIRDMTAQRIAEQKIRELNQRLLRDNMELESLNRELEAFSYSVSHDLRAPLRAIEGFSKALLEDAGDKLDHDSLSHVDRVRKAARRMEVLIADLLKLASVSRLDLNKDIIDLTALAREIVRELAVSDPDRSTEIDVAPGLRASADPRLLRIALENLLGNAWKFTAKSAPTMISVGQVMTGAGPAFFIRDNGVGFDMTQSARLFRPFQRLHDSQFPGTGIGLATTQRVIRRHGGEIWAKSQRGDGATFFFTLN